MFAGTHHAVFSTAACFWHVLHSSVYSRAAYRPIEKPACLSQFMLWVLCCCNAACSTCRSADASLLPWLILDCTCCASKAAPLNSKPADQLGHVNRRHTESAARQGGCQGHPPSWQPVPVPCRWEARNASGMAAGGNLEMINVTERKLFMDKRKRIAVISEAASAGISLHADRQAELALRSTQRTAMPLGLLLSFETASSGTQLSQTVHVTRLQSRVPVPLSV